MNGKFWLIFCQLVHFVPGWELPPAQFLIDFANFHYRKSITFYLPGNITNKTNFVNWYNIFSERYSINTYNKFIANIE